MDNDNSKLTTISYHQFGSMQVEEFSEMDIYGFVLMVKQICEKYQLDVYNFYHFKIAVSILKMQVSYN
jgi:hypothetical protein